MTDQGSVRNTKTLISPASYRGDYWQRVVPLASIVEIVFRIIIRVIVEALVLDISPFDGRLHAAGAADLLPIPACPVYRVLIPVVDPVFVIFEYQHHATGPMRREIVYI